MLVTTETEVWIQTEETNPCLAENPLTSSSGHLHEEGTVMDPLGGLNMIFIQTFSDTFTL